MSSSVKYMPIFRLRSQEKQVLLSRNFGDNVWPCVEIIKRFEQKPREPKKDKKKMANEKEKKKEPKSFEDVYVPILTKIKSPRVFVDLPVHMKEPPNLKPEVVTFMREVVAKRATRTEYMLKFAPYADQIVPVISTYWQRTNEPNSIKLQETDLRKSFNTLAFRTFPLSFKEDIKQILTVVKAGDFIIFDLGDTLADKEDPDVLRVELKELAKVKDCEVIIVRSIVSNEIKNSGIDHGKKIDKIVSDLPTSYKELHGSGFGDYAGIKKDGVTKGAGISPGFIFFDPVENSYYGYRGDKYEENGKVIRKIKDFEDIIVPDLLKSEVIERIRADKLPYLDDENVGWRMLNNIQSKGESGKSQAKFKRISMEHYLHCIITQINAGNFS